MKLAAFLFLYLPALQAGPAEFGWAELQKAAQERGIPPRYIPLEADISSSLPAESFDLETSHISGGDLRGLMYGLLEAAEQIRNSGKITKGKFSPTVQLRGVRLEITPATLEEPWFHTQQFWNDYLANLARARINRLQLEFTVLPFPHILQLPLFEGIGVEGLTPFERGRNLDAIKMIASLALSYAVDFAIGIGSFEPSPKVSGFPVERKEDYTRSAIETLLADVHPIRAISVPAQPDLYKPIAAAVSSVGRFVTIESTENPLHPNWRVIENLTPHHPLPPLKDLSGTGTQVLRRIPPSEFTDPQYARLTARCIPLGAMGIEFSAAPHLSEPETRLAYFAWGRLAYDPAAPDSVWRSNPLDEAMASAARTYPRQTGESTTQFVQRLHWNASQIERDIHGQASSKLVDALRRAADRARYEGRLQWGQYLLEAHQKNSHDSLLYAAMREFQAAKVLAAKLELPVSQIDGYMASTSSMLPETPSQHSPVVWPVPPPRRR